MHIHVHAAHAVQCDCIGFSILLCTTYYAHKYLHFFNLLREENCSYVLKIHTLITALHFIQSHLFKVDPFELYCCVIKYNNPPPRHPHRTSTFLLLIEQQGWPCIFDTCILTFTKVQKVNIVATSDWGQEASHWLQQSLLEHDCCPTEGPLLSLKRTRGQKSRLEIVSATTCALQWIYSYALQFML